MRVCSLSFLLTFLACLNATAFKAEAQLDLPLGFKAELLFEETQNPYFFNGYALGLEEGEIYVALGRRILRIREDEPAEVIHEFQLGGSAGLLMRPRGRKQIYFSDFKTDDLHRIDLLSGHRSKLHLPAFTFDIAVSQQGEVFASAFPNFLRSFGRAGIYRVHGEGSVPELFFEVDGPSGPITFDAEGALYYAEQSDIFPSPPGSIRLLRFPQFASPNFGLNSPDKDNSGWLPAFRGSEVVAALDGAYDIAFDDRGRLYVTDPFDGGIERSMPDSLVFDPLPLLPPNGESSLQMQFISEARGEFAAFQPDFGSQLLLSTTGNAATRVWSIRPARLSLQVIKQPTSGPG
ncbi:MAG: NHL repeat-containing protein, partial [Planctomycetota bacterium]